MNGDYKALCFTKRRQGILRVLLSSLVDSLEKDNAMEEGREGRGKKGSGLCQGGGKGGRGQEPGPGTLWTLHTSLALRHSFKAWL